MAKTHFNSVDEYVASLSMPAGEALQRVRAALRKALPEGQEVVSYQIGCIKIEGRAVIWFAGWAHHYSVYPASEALVTRFARELARYEVSKGTIRFPLDKAVPSALIARLAKFRAREVADRKRAATKEAPKTSATRRAPKTSVKRLAKVSARSR